MPGDPHTSKMALVVDDSMLIRHAVCRFLEERGFHVESATNGVEALQLLDYFIPNVIITDLSMPYMGGVELIERIRARKEFAHTPILILSAPRFAAELPCELVAGAAALIYKNIDIESQLSRALLFNMVEDAQ